MGVHDVMFRERFGDPEAFAWESLRVASRGDRRARTLDLIAWLLVFVGAAIAATALGVGFTGSELSENGKAFAVLVALGGLLVPCVAAALLFGFAAVVRNTSRSLATDVMRWGTATAPPATGR